MCEKLFMSRQKMITGRRLPIKDNPNIVEIMASLVAIDETKIVEHVDAPNNLPVMFRINYSVLHDLGPPHFTGHPVQSIITNGRKYWGILLGHHGDQITDVSWWTTGMIPSRNQIKEAVERILDEEPTD